MCKPLEANIFEFQLQLTIHDVIHVLYIIKDVCVCVFLILEQGIHSSRTTL